MVNNPRWFSFAARFSVMLSLCLAVVMLLCMSTGAAVSDDKKESFYNSALMSLESWLEAPGEQGTDQLDALVTVFDELARYEQSRDFCKYYIPLLKNAVEEDFGHDFSFQIERLEAEDRFQEYLEDLNSSSIMTSKELIAYAKGREAQAEGNDDQAAEYYRQSNGYYDAGDRLDAIFMAKYRSYYDNGMAAFENDDLVNAYLYFDKAGGYEDSKELMEYIEKMIGHAPEPGEIWPTPAATPEPTPEPTPVIPQIEIRGIIKFGHYEQDNNPANGPEEIEWLVLEMQDDKALLISKKGLDSKPYNEKNKSVTWETCSLRKWLNDEFFGHVFSQMEQKCILSTEIINGGQEYDGWKTKGGKTTNDRAFQLSYAEANRYLGVTADSADNKKARMAPTAYAMMNGASEDKEFLTEDGEHSWWWWLRSPGQKNQGHAAAVTASGYLGECVANRQKDDRSGMPCGCVRPALWIDVSLIDGMYK